MNFVVDFFKDILYKIGLWKKNAQIVFLGLDNAGKSTLISLLKTGRITQLDPTKHAHAEELQIGNVSIKAFDLGGHAAMRKTWRQYYPKLDAIVYLIDSADPTRFAESRRELENITASEDLGAIPILALGNKIDKEGAVSEEELRLALGLASQGSFGVQKVERLNQKPVELFMCSVVKKSGYADGFKWLTKALP